MATKKFNYGVFVCGISAGILCFALILVKYVMRMPVTPVAGYALLILPSLWFYVQSEYAWHRAKQQNTSAGTTRYLRPCYAAIALVSCWLVLYVFPHLFQSLVLPDYVPDFFHYSQHALVALGVGILLIRLHALSDQAFLVFLGVLVAIAALFFLAIRLPEVAFGITQLQSAGQTFEFFTLVMVGLSYIVLLTTSHKGFLKNAFCTVGHIREELWASLRIFLFVILLGMSHGLFFLTLLNLDNQRFIGLIFLLLAGLWILTGYAYQHILPYSVAYLEVLAAIFSARFAIAYWSETWIIWLLIGLFILLILLYSLFFKHRYAYAAESLYLWLFLTSICVIYEQFAFYGFQAKWGMAPLFVLWLAIFAVPVPAEAKERQMFRMFLGAVVYTPTLLFFLQQGPPSIAYLPNTLLVAVLISCAIVIYRMYHWEWSPEETAKEIRILHHLHWFLIQPYSLISVFVLSTLAVFVVHFFSLVVSPALFTDHFFSMLIVQAIMVFYWFDLARKQEVWWGTVAAETMIAGAIFTLRQGVPKHLDILWTDHWDMLIGLFVALAITTVHPLLERETKAVRLPIRVTLFILPVLTAIYALDYAVDFEFFSMILLPFYSVLFLWQAYRSRDRFVLAYAFLVINSYLILLFLHQQFHSLQLYVTPACLSVLILVEVFRNMTSKATANFVRGATLFVLLGVALFQAIIMQSLSPLAHLIVLGLSSLAIVTAGFLRVRIFAATGAFCFFVDLVAIVYIVLSRQDAETLKGILGGGLTVIGLLTLAGYYFYRKHKARIDRIFGHLKGMFLSWE